MEKTGVFISASSEWTRKSYRASCRHLSSFQNDAKKIKTRFHVPILPVYRRYLVSFLPRKMPSKSSSTQIPTNKKKRNFAMVAAAPATPVNPRSPVTKAIIKEYQSPFEHGENLDRLWADALRVSLGCSLMELLIRSTLL